MVKFIVVGRRTWRWTLTLAILLGLGTWAFLGDPTRPPLTGEEIRAAWEGVRSWVLARWPGGSEDGAQLASAPSPQPGEAVTATATQAASAGGEAASLAAVEAVPVVAQAPASLPGNVNVTQLPAGTGYDLFRLDRARVRSERIELLRQVLDDTTASEGRRAEAQQALLAELEQLEQELAIENLLRIQGYEGAVAVLSRQGVEVVLPQVLDAEQASRIGGLVANVAGVGVQEVTLRDGLTAVR